MGWFDHLFPSSRAFNRWQQASRAWDKYKETGSRTELSRAIELYSEMVNAGLPGIFEQDKAPIYNSYAVALRARFNEDADARNLDLAIEVASRLAVPLADDTPSQQSDVMANLGEMYRDRFEVAGNREDLKEAERLTRAAARAPGLQPEQLASQLTAVGTVLVAKFDAYGDFEDLDRAMYHFEEALAIPECDRPIVLTNMGAVHFRRFNRTRNVNDLNSMIDVNRQALAGLKENPFAYSIHLANLGGSLASRGELLKEERDLVEGIRHLEEALALVGPNTSISPGILNSLGTANHMLYDLSGDRHRLEGALHQKHVAIDAIGGWESAPPSIALSYTSTMQEFASSEADIGQVVEMYRRLATDNSGRDAAKVVEAARRWQLWAASRHAWDEVAESYKLCSGQIERLVAMQALRPYKEDWLANAVGLATEAAFAFFMLGDANAAVDSIEDGRVTLLAESLKSSQICLEKAADTGRTDLIRQRKEVFSMATSDGALPAQFESLTQQARSVTDSMAPATREPPEAETAVYLCATSTAGLAIIAHQNGDIEGIVLPELADAKLVERLVRYNSLYSLAAEAGAFHAWRRELLGIGQWLWDCGIGEVAEAIRRKASVDDPIVAFVPTGAIGLLPLHAAWTADQSRTGGRKYLLDCVVPRYLPSRRSLRARAAVDSPVAAVIRGPNLLGADRDAQALRSWIKDSEVLPVGAPPEVVLDRMLKKSVVHFACHGISSEDPRENRLEVSVDGDIRLDDILRLNLANVRLVYLAACESAHYGLRVPDEVIGLPVAFLEAGGLGVIASQWLIPSAAAAEIAWRFYGLWLKQEKNPVRALRDAQVLTRDTSAESKVADLPWGKDLGLPGPTMNAGTPHEDPYWWAGFQYVGF